MPLIISALQPNLGGSRFFIWLHKSLRTGSTRGSKLEADCSVCPGLDDVGEYMI